MAQGLYWTFAFNIIVNSIMSFVTVALVVEVCLFVLRVKRHRFISLCRCLPFCKIGLDLLLYNFSTWALVEGIHPMNAPIGTRSFSLMLGFPLFSEAILPITSRIQFTLVNGKTFTIADLLTFFINPLWIKLNVVLAFAISFILSGIQSFRLIRSTQWISKIVNEATPCPRIILNLGLLKSLTDNIDHIDLASAIAKVTRLATSKCNRLLVAYFIKKEMTKFRLQVLLKKSPYEKPTVWTAIQCFMAICLFTSLLLGKFWIF